MNHTDNHALAVIRPILLVLLVAALLPRPVAAQPQPAPGKQPAPAQQAFELWLKLGQSNAVGTLSLKDPALQDPLDVNGVDAPDPRVHEVNRPSLPNPPWAVPPGVLTHLQRERSWDSSTNPLNDISYHQTFGKVRVAANPVIGTLAIFNGARGGTTLQDDWMPGRRLFEVAVAEANTFLANAPAYQFKGIIWHQGESDAIDARTQTQYESDLAFMVRELRRRITGGKHAVFIAGTMSSAWRAVPNPNHTKDEIHQAQLRIPQYIPRSAIVDLDDLVVTDDIIHFDRDHLRTIGSRYAAAAANLLATPAPTQLPSYQFKYDATAMSFTNQLGPDGVISGQTLTAGSQPVLTTVPQGGPVAGFTASIEVDPAHYTKALWVKLDVPADPITSFLSDGANGTASLMLASRVGHGSYLGSAGNATFLDGSNFATGVSPLVPDTWVHLCVTYSGSEFMAFANGVPLANGPFTAATAQLSATANLDIGHWVNYSPSVMRGQIDNVVVLPYAAHAEEIARLMH